MKWFAQFDIIIFSHFFTNSFTMKKQLFSKAVRAVLALVLFAGAVTFTNAQSLPPVADAVSLVSVKLQQISNTRPAVRNAQAQSMTPAQAQATYRIGFYKRVLYNLKGQGTTVQDAIDNAYSVYVARNASAANALRQEIIDYLTKS